MDLFIDTAKVEEIREANDMGIICGVTTNPSLIAKEGRDFNEVIREIVSIVDGPISGEVKATTTQAAEMVKEGRAIAAIHPNMVVKIPMTSGEDVSGRRHQDERDACVYCESGASGGKSGGNLCISVLRTLG